MTMTDARPDTTTATITLPHSDAMLAGLASVALHTASARESTPVIEHIRVDSRTFIATNRYTVGEWTHTTEPTDSIDFILIPRTAAAWLTKQTGKVLGGVASIVFAPESITVLYSDDTVAAIHRFAPQLGNFPPVERLFESAQPTLDATPVGLAPKFLTLMVKGATLTSPKDPMLTIAQTVARGKGPGPVLVTFNERFRGLIQPRLILR